MGLLENNEGNEVEKKWSPEDGDPFLGYGGDSGVRDRLKNYGMASKMAKDNKDREDKEKIQAPPLGDTV